MLGGLAVSYGFQLYPALIVICYNFRGWPMQWTPQGVTAGLIVGIVAVTLTYYWPAYRYTLSIHSAGWGIIFNILTIWLVSFLIGATPEGKKELVGFQTGVRESAQRAGAQPPHRHQGAWARDRPGPRGRRRGARFLESNRAGLSQHPASKVLGP